MKEENAIGESVCVVNKGNTGHRKEDSIASDPPAHTHLDTNHGYLQKKIVKDHKNKEGLCRSSPIRLQRSTVADIESRDERTVDSWNNLE